jgi:hypothetical protein
MVCSFYRVFAIKVLLSIEFYQAFLEDEKARQTALMHWFPTFTV